MQWRGCLLVSVCAINNMHIYICTYKIVVVVVVVVVVIHKRVPPHRSTLAVLYIYTNIYVIYMHA